MEVQIWREDSDPVGRYLRWQCPPRLDNLAEENGISMDSGCRAGSCGTCVTAIKSGEVEYLSEPGEPPDSGSCLACICVPKGNLELDA